MMFNRQMAFIVFAISVALAYNLMGCMKKENLLTEKEIFQKIKEIEMNHMPQVFGSSTANKEQLGPDPAYVIWKKKLDELVKLTISEKARHKQEENLVLIENHMKENPVWIAQVKDMSERLSVIAKERMKLCELEINKAQRRILSGEDKNKVISEVFQKIEELDRGPGGMSLGIRHECIEKLKKI